MSDERTCATCWHCYDGADSGTCRRCRASGEAVSEYREDPEAMAAHLRARVAELEREMESVGAALANVPHTCGSHRHIPCAGCEAAKIARSAPHAQRLASAESRASAAVEAHSELLSRIAGDGTLDAMERASAAEQRVRELEGALREADAMYQAIRAFGQLPGVANTDAEAKAFDVMDDAADKFERSRAALAASDSQEGKP